MSNSDWIEAEENMAEEFIKTKNETDKELLELAAKAAGIEIGWESGKAFLYEPEICALSDVWNPLTDDGDALRLAVKLGFELVCSSKGRYSETGKVFKMTFVSGPDYDCVERHNEDPYAATRRAIVRAAAEIGRTL